MSIKTHVGQEGGGKLLQRDGYVHQSDVNVECETVGSEGLGGDRRGREWCVPLPFTIAK